MLTPRAHQAEYVSRDALRPDWALLWEPRTGKTLATLGGEKRWIEESEVRRILVVAPKTVCSTVWWPETRTELGAKGTFPVAKPLEVIPLYTGTLADRTAHVRWLIERRKERVKMGLDPMVEIAIINYEALEPLAEILLRWGVQALVLDEAHRVKSSSANRSRAAYRIGRQASFRRALTGTPAPNGLVDIYGIWKVLSPATFGTNKKAFMERYCNVHPFYPSKVISYKTEHLAELQDKAFAIASVKFRSECFDVPREDDNTIEFELPKSARKLYDRVVNDHILELKNGDEAQEVALTHTLSRLQQLRQIAVGYSRIHDESGRVITWHHKDKLDIVKTEVEDIIESGNKVVVYHAFRPEGAAIVQMLKDYRPQILHGGIEADERPQMIDRFRFDANFPLMIAQENVASLGISFREANYDIFLSHGQEHDAHKQARDRIFAPLEEMPNKWMVHTYPTALRTVEVTLRKSLKTKATIEEMLMRGKLADSFYAIAYGEV